MPSLHKKTLIVALFCLCYATAYAGISFDGMESKKDFPKTAKDLIKYNTHQKVKDLVDDMIIHDVFKGMKVSMFHNLKTMPRNMEYLSLDGLMIGRGHMYLNLK